MAGFLRRLLRPRRHETGVSLEEYAIYLETSHWRSAPQPNITRARVIPRLFPLREVRAVVWDVYGTLLYCRHDGESSRFLEENPAVLLAFDRTIEFFRMWPAMSKSRLSPGQYLHNQFRELAGQLLVEKNVRGRQHPELKLDQVWERLINRLRKGGYRFEEKVVGPPSSFARKVALFCDESLERTVLFPGALEAVKTLAERGIRQGLAGDGQVYTNAQLVKSLVRAGGPRALGELFDPLLCSYSFEVGRRRPDPALYQALAARLAQYDLEPEQVLVVGNDLLHDVMVPATLGFRTALFAGDAATARLRRDEPEVARARPDAVLLEIGQIAQVVGA